ncbi:hypothetical protein BDQ17DRAFT_1372149 [Cyathus striatus]|nr:hypothetical protein BDQ17DRAFT_1372149 [Cyathus striatus]
MRTISTTHIALATDLTRENGAAEVASIFLQDQHSDVVPSDSDSECLNMERSVKMSPEKAGTTRGSKVIRKGLAARAFAVYTESRMAMSLWKKEIELHSHRRSTPDLTMLIVKILHAPAPLRLTHAEAKPDSTTVFALCIRPSKNSSKKELLRVLFSYASVESSGSSCIAPQFAEGSVAHIWLPWLELSLQDMQHLTRLDDTLPTCLPVWLDDSSTLTDLTHLPLSNTVVFSSRFVISPSRGLLECIQ